MVAAIFNALPDWMMSIIIAFVVWFGLNYIWVAPHYFEVRTVETFSANINGKSYTDKDSMRSCFRGVMFENFGSQRFDMAVFTSTFGFFGSYGQVYSLLLPNHILNERCAKYA